MFLTKVMNTDDSKLNNSKDCALIGNQCLIVCFVMSLNPIEKISGYYVCLQKGVFFAVWGIFLYHRALQRSVRQYVTSACQILKQACCKENWKIRGGAMQRKTQTCITTIRHSTLIKKGFRLDSTFSFMLLLQNNCFPSCHAPVQSMHH